MKLLREWWDKWWWPFGVTMLALVILSPIAWSVLAPEANGQETGQEATSEFLSPVHDSVETALRHRGGFIQLDKEPMVAIYILPRKGNHPLSPAQAGTWQ